MTQRTCDIIMACKGNMGLSIIQYSAIERVKRYLSWLCKCPLETYSSQIMEKIISEALFDYVDTCDKPSAILRRITDITPEPLSIAEKIAIAFVLEDVSAGINEYMNGFTKELIKQSAKNSYEYKKENGDDM